MPEDSAIRLKNDYQHLGAIKISPRVLEFIAGIAASQVNGVSGMHATLANSVGAILGRSEHRRGVRLTMEKDGTLTFDVAVYIDYGQDVPKVAAEIQDKIKQQVALMTDLKVNLVNVHVQGITPQKQDENSDGIDPNDIFGQEQNDEDGEED